MNDKQPRQKESRIKCAIFFAWLAILRFILNAEINWKGQRQKVKEHSGHVTDEIRKSGGIKGERWGEEEKEVGRERLDVSVEERQRRRREESARNRPLNENVIRGSRNKAEKLGEDGEDVEVGGGRGGAVAVRAK